MIERVKTLSRVVDERYPRFAKIGRYLLSGGIATATDLVLLYVGTEWLGMWYLLSSICAFGIAFCVSFILQKFWTFQDHGTENMRMQVGGYLGVAVTNLGINTLLVFIFVEQVALHYMVAQIIASVLIACESYFVYQYLIFRAPRDVP